MSFYTRNNPRSCGILIGDRAKGLSSCGKPATQLLGQSWDPPRPVCDEHKNEVVESLPLGTYQKWDTQMRPLYFPDGQPD